jgi:hypothetical protein
MARNTPGDASVGDSGVTVPVGDLHSATTVDGDVGTPASFVNVVWTTMRSPIS